MCHGAIGVFAWQVVIRIRDKDGHETTITPPKDSTVIVEEGGKRIASFPPEKPTPSEAAAPAAPKASRPDPLVIEAQPSTLKPDERMSGIALSSALPPCPACSAGRSRPAVIAARRAPWRTTPTAAGSPSAARDGAIRLFDTETGALSRVMLGHDAKVGALAWHPGGRVLASGGDDQTIRLWDAGTARQLHVLRGHKAPAMTLAWSHDGTMLASSGGNQDAVRLWEPKSGRCTQELPRAAWYNALAWSPDGPRLALKIMDQSVLVRDVSGKSADLLIVEGNSGGLECIAWSPDGRTVATGNAKTNLVSLWDSRTGSRVQTIEGCKDVNSVAWSPDGEVFATGEVFNVKIWEIATGRLLRKLSNHSMTVTRSLSWSPDGKTLAAANSQAGMVGIWEARTGRRVRSHEWYPELLDGNVSWSPDGRTLVRNMGESLKFWDAATGRLLRMSRFGGGSVGGYHISPDGRLVALTSGSSLRIEESQTGRIVLQTTVERPATSAAWSPDGTRLALGGEKFLQIWDLDARVALRTISVERDWVSGLAWSTEGTRLAAANGRLVRLFDTATWQPTVTLGKPESRDHWLFVTSLLWWPDGKTLASGDRGGVVRVWDAGTGESRRTRQAHTGPVSNLQCAPDGKSILSGSDTDREVNAWDPELGKRLKRVPNSGTVVSPDGKTIAGAGQAALFLTDFEHGRPLGVIVSLSDPNELVVSAEGHYRGTPGVEDEFVYVVQTEKSQETLTPQEFATRYGWKNDAESVRFSK